MSVYLPVAITLLIFVGGVIVYLVTPGQFTAVISILVGLSLLAYLWFSTRRAPRRLQLLALLLALPALAGISAGMIAGRLSWTLIGIAITFVLLIFYRVFSTPVSYRFALRAWQRGESEQALDFVERAIAARPDFWESYQLRALIFFTADDIPRAERSAKEAVERKPDVLSVHNTLGQIYLAQNEFAKAQEAFTAALILEPNDNVTRFYLGQCVYRQKKYREAAEILVDATSGGMRFLEFELLLFFYLYNCFGKLKLKEQREEAMAKMIPLAPDGVPAVQRYADGQPASHAHTPLLQVDAKAAAELLAPHLEPAEGEA